MRLQELLQDLDYIELVGSPDRVVAAVHHDSRQVGPDDVFVAIKGQHIDGRKFAANLQAAAVITDGPVTTAEGVAVIRVSCARRALAQAAASLCGHPGQQLPVVGITGTNGKTTVSWMLESMATSAGVASAIVGTTGHRIAGQTRPAKHTTPEAPVIQQILKEAVEADCGVAIMEVSSIGLEMSRVNCIPFQVAVYTNLSQDHLDFHGTMTKYLRAKARLFEELLAPKATAVLNGDAPEHSEIKPQCHQVWRYGTHPSHEIRVRKSELTLQGTTAVIDTPVGSGELELPLIGSHNLANAMAALGAALALNWPLEESLSGLKNLPIIPGRLEPIENACDLTVLVDYAHSPDALQTVLSTIRSISPSNRQIWTMFGCGGDRDRSKRPQMGATAAQLSDHCVLTSDNPRSEDPLSIINDVRSGITKAIHIEPDRSKAIEWIIAAAEPGDIVLLAGKGHERTQSIGNQVIELDDRALARTALRRREQRP